MAYEVQLVYFRPTGKYLTHARTVIAFEEIEQIWEEIHEMRRIGRLPGLRPNAGRDLFVVVDVPDHPRRVPHLVMPPIIDDDDVTPPRIATSEMAPLVRVHLEDIPRTTTRDVVRTPDPEPEPLPAVDDDEITPVDVPIPRRPPNET